MSHKVVAICRGIPIEEHIGSLNNFFPFYWARLPDKVLVYHSVASLQDAIAYEFSKTEADHRRIELERQRIRKLIR